MNGNQWLRILLAGLVITLLGCITDYSPRLSIVELAPGESQIFTATSDDPRAKLAWYLDDVQVAYNISQFVWVAEPSAEAHPRQRRLVVREEQGRYPMLAQSITWQISTKAPPVPCYLDEDGDGFGDLNKKRSSQNPQVNCVIDNDDCNDSDAAIYPGSGEVCNGVDDDCDGEVDEDLMLLYFRDADGDTFGNAAVTAQACQAPAGYVAYGNDCDDNNPAVNPAALDILNGWDDNCNGVADDAFNQEVDLTASDVESGLPFVKVAWNPIYGADYYKVYRSPHAADGVYELVGDNIAGTSFDYVETWEEDVRAVIGDMPAMSPTADFGRTVSPFPERQAFMQAIRAYRDDALPVLLNFKAPAYFKVQACNAIGCTDLSAAGFGQAEMIHTAEFSEVAQLVIPLWSYPMLIALADGAPLTNGLLWCGIDLCGSGGGIARGRVSAPGYVNIDLQHDSYTEVSPGYPGAYFLSNGMLGGNMEPAQAANGEYIVYGEFDVNVTGRAAVELDAFVHIGNYRPDGTRLNEGVANITYKGMTHQFSLPIMPGDGVNGHAAPPPQAVSPMVEIPPQAGTIWWPSESLYPLPEVQKPHCLRVSSDYTNPECALPATGPFYPDLDGDGYGDPSASPVMTTLPPAGYVADKTDCNDNDLAIHPNSSEACNGVDDNCNGRVDECCRPFYADTDGDGYGNDNSVVQACEPPQGHVSVGGDCNDADAAIHPLAKEICNGVDDDCDGALDLEDPDCKVATYFQDADGDGYGNDGVSMETCAAPPTGYLKNNGDCDDTHANIHPGAIEGCDDVDENCNGMEDEPYLIFYADSDGDGYGNPEKPIHACAEVSGYVTDHSDCEDTLVEVHPGAEEICGNAIDENCDGIVLCDSRVVEVHATDLGTDLAPNAADRTHITIVWNPVPEATYYRVYRSIYDDNGVYKLVGDAITGTSFDYVQTWEEDVRAVIGDMPAMSPTADFGQTAKPYPERQAYIQAIQAYRESARPALFNFKAPAYFKVQACNEAGCTEMSAADLGQAELVHASEFSEVAQLVIPLWSYPMLIALADMPSGTNSLTWCGIDLCGSGGGIARARVLVPGFVNLDLQHDHYTEVLPGYPAAYFISNGTLGGNMEPLQAIDGEFILYGEFDVNVPGHAAVAIDAFAHIGKYNPDGSRVSEGVANITYNGTTYQFSLPLMPGDGVNGHATDLPQAVIPTVEIPPQSGTIWWPSETMYPLPWVKETHCIRVSNDYTIPACPASIVP